MENVLVALSNFPVLNVISLAYHKNDMITLAVVSYVGLASFLSHLFENHKHGMSGIYFSSKTSYILNRMDVSGVILTVLRFMYLYYEKYSTDISILFNHQCLVYFALFGLILNIISEYDKYNPDLKWLYIPTHMSWHIIIFICMAEFYDNIL